MQILLGAAYEDMKRGKNRKKVRKLRKRVGTDKELEKQREKYHHKKRKETG